MSADVRLDLEMRVDEEIDRQIDTDIVRIVYSTLPWYNETEFVSYECVPNTMVISRGMFEERCIARGFARCNFGWKRGENFEGARRPANAPVSIQWQEELLAAREAELAAQEEADPI